MFFMSRTQSRESAAGNCVALGAFLFFAERGPRETVLEDRGCRGLLVLPWSVSLMAVAAEGLSWYPLWPSGCTLRPVSPGQGGPLKPQAAVGVAMGAPDQQGP